MSESSSYGESSYGSNSSKRSSSGESSYSSPSYSPPTPKEEKSDFSLITQKLKSIESFVSKELIAEEKKSFIKMFRQIIVDNETQVIQFPTATFFISKFEEFQDVLLTEELKTKILASLEAKQNKEKQNNSKLKYW